MRLKGYSTVENSENLSEWERDRLLIQLTIRLGKIRNGAYACYGHYLLPIAIAFSASGVMIYFAFRFSSKILPAWLLYFGDFTLTLGIILLLLVLMIIAFDFMRTQYLNTVDGETMAEYECMHFYRKTDEYGEHPTCEYFNQALDDFPLCIICPVYEMKKQNDPASPDDSAIGK